MAMMEPPPRLRISGMTARAQYQLPRASISKVRCHSSSSSSRMVPMLARTPALLMRMSICPKRSQGLLRHPSDGRRVAHVRRHDQHLAAGAQ